VRAGQEDEFVVVREKIVRGCEADTWGGVLIVKRTSLIRWEVGNGNG
jgi:hypothetical protein